MSNGTSSFALLLAFMLIPFVTGNFRVEVDFPDRCRKGFSKLKTSVSSALRAAISETLIEYGDAVLDIAEYWSPEALENDVRDRALSSGGAIEPAEQDQRHLMACSRPSCSKYRSCALFCGYARRRLGGDGDGEQQQRLLISDETKELARVKMTLLLRQAIANVCQLKVCMEDQDKKNATDVNDRKNKECLCICANYGLTVEVEATGEEVH